MRKWEEARHVWGMTTSPSLAYHVAQSTSSRHQGFWNAHIQPFDKSLVTKKQNLCYLQVVTDLRSEWHKLWMDDCNICQRRWPTRAQAVKVINDLLTGSIKATQGGIQAAIAGRRRIAEHMFATVG